MLTPQEVSSRSFTKTMMGGYNMTMVDEFLDELTDDYTSLYKENATLKAKMKVLVERVEEYRATEDSMRATLLTAQRMAESIVKEAEEKRDGILHQAETAARERLESLRKEAEGYQKRLQQGQAEIRRFVAESRSLCEKELRFLDEFPELPLEDEAEEPVRAEETAKAEEIGRRVPAPQEAEDAPAVPEAAVPETAVPEAAVPEAAVSEAAAPQAAPAVPRVPEAPSAEAILEALAAKEVPSAEDLSATRRVNINELKFGPNYRGGAE